MKQQLKLFAVTMAVALPANAHSGAFIKPAATALPGADVTETDQITACLAKADKNKCLSVGKPDQVWLAGTGS
jgi:hypothetical protein